MIEIVKDKELLSKPCEIASIHEAYEISSILLEEIKKIDNALGLAANQIGFNKQIFVIKTEKNGYKLVYNSKIIKKNHPFISKREGCLSFPEIYLDTIRYQEIYIEDAIGKDYYFGYDALVFQHEQDHIDGVTFFERKVPEKYSPCFCGSNKKFKFCCMSKV